MKKRIVIPGEEYVYDRPEWCPHRNIGTDGRHHCGMTVRPAKECGEEFPDDCPLEDA